MEVHKMGINELEDTYKGEVPQIETEHFILRKITPEDSHNVISYLSDYIVLQHCNNEVLETDENARKEIKWFNNLPGSSSIKWGITVKGRSIIIGTCGFHNWVKGHHRAEIGYELLWQYWQKGIMTEVLQALLKYGFENMNFNRLQALVSLNNVASQKLLLKLGFKHEGVMRQYECDFGRFEDLDLFSMLKEEYSI
jgi:[ribosomal protein S5]-alanine N-acetyltransferase